MNNIYLIAEIGINHNGDMQITKKLIDAAHACSWDCVKFQKRTPKICVPKHQWDIERDTPWGRMKYIDYKHRIEFGTEEYNYIDRYCSEKPIDWTASVWDIESLNFISKYDVPFLKIPSPQLTNTELLKAAALTNKKIIISTGMSTFEEIDAAVEILKWYAKDFCLLHCNSAYPATADDLNLKMIRVYKDRYDCQVGYSGHEYGLITTLFAIAFGAEVIERHITLDHEMWGTDQRSSVEIQGMDKLYKHIARSMGSIGDGVKRICPEELKSRMKLRGY